MEPRAGILESDYVSAQSVMRGLLSLYCPKLNTLCPSGVWLLAWQPLPLASVACKDIREKSGPREESGWDAWCQLPLQSKRECRWVAGAVQRGKVTPGWLAAATCAVPLRLVQDVARKVISSGNLGMYFGLWSNCCCVSEAQPCSMWTWVISTAITASINRIHLTIY